MDPVGRLRKCCLARTDVGLRLFFLVFAGLNLSYASRSPLTHPSRSVVLPGVSGTGLTPKETELKKNEENRVFLLGLKIMQKFGCSDFEENAYAAFVDFLRGQAELPPRGTGGRVVIDNLEHARMLTGHFTLLNNTQKTDTPTSKVQNSRAGYSKTFQALSRIINEDLYRSYGTNVDLSKIAADLENPKSQYGAYFKSKIREKIKELGQYSSVDHWNVACPTSGEAQKKTKNAIVMVSVTPSSSGNKNILYLDEYMKKTSKKRSDVLDFTLSAVSFKKKEEPKTEVASRTPQSGRPIPPPQAQATRPSSVKPPVHSSTAPKVTQPKPVAPAPKPAPSVAPAPEQSFEEQAQERLRAIPKQGTKARGLYDRFLNWIDRRNLDTVDDFHEIVISNLSKNPSFKQYLIDRNPFGQMCVNYKNLSTEQRERILTKSFLVHMLSENFDSNSIENLGDYQNDSVGPWQTAMNTRNYGCKFLNHEELKYNVDKNVHCLMVFYSYREFHYDKIYGRSGDAKVSGSKLKGHGLHWSVLKEGSGHAYFEEKYEPLFRSATKGECQSTYLNTSGKTTVNGHTPDAVRDFLNAVI